MSRIRPSDTPAEPSTGPVRRRMLPDIVDRLDVADPLARGVARGAGTVRDATRAWLRAAAERLRPEGPLIVRLVVASILSFLVVQAVDPGTGDLTGPLTSVLVVQANLHQTLRMGVQRVAAVLLGVAVAVVLSTWIGLNWWSLGAAIGASLVLAVAADMEDQKLEVPISAMLILAVSQHDTAAWVRMSYTLIGAAVGIALTVLWPPPVQTRDAVEATQLVAHRLAEVVRKAAAEIPGGLARATTRAWLEDIGKVLPLVDAASRAVDEAEDSRRLNPRAVDTVDMVPVVREGLTSLDNAALSMRQLLFSLARGATTDDPASGGLSETSAREGDADGVVSDAGSEGDPVSGTGANAEINAELNAAFSVVLFDIADAVDAFGELIAAEARGREDEAEDRLAEALSVLGETRAFLTQLALIDAGQDVDAWLVRGSALSAVSALIDHLDAEAHARARGAAHARARTKAERRAALAALNPWGIVVLDPLDARDEPIVRIRPEDVPGRFSGVRSAAIRRASAVGRRGRTIADTARRRIGRDGGHHPHQGR